ncbi:rab GDP dissociation inhibitor alpha-like [Styela clava]|uniref:rab GDP dissociation inhibitor alpha-like n=1 Tax=Styela clava TaxID=7725 RepID=UPI001939B15C|nr:rab GDP dissociation inhibitor alpha-like [Styela clava]
MDEVYDVIVLGTGLTECVLAGICSCNEKLKVLQMDRNDYYGAEATSMNLEQLYEKFMETKQTPEQFGRSRDWNVDLIPKFLMADGKLVKLLVSTGVTTYLNFKCAAGSYVYREGKIYKIPANPKEALESKLMGLFEKRRFRKFLMFAGDFDPTDPKTHQGINLNATISEVFKSYGLDDNTQTFIGHAMALYRNDNYLKENCLETLAKIKLYIRSMERYGNSPYLYPLYGLGELPQGFARRCAVFGGTFMLNKPITGIKPNSDGLIEVTSNDETVKGKQVIGDPSYFPDRVKKVGQVVRAICILSHPIPDTNNAVSCQIILPQSQVKRNHDIYVFCVSGDHEVCPKGKFLALVSTVVETAKPEDELREGLKLLGSIDQKFIRVSDIFAPINDNPDDNIFVTRSYDATTHFETTCDDIVDLYEKVFKRKFDFDKMKCELNQEE